MSWVLPPPEIPSLPVAGTQDRYPVGRNFCIGRNYAAHAAEMGNAVSDAPWVFTKSPAGLAPSGAVLPYPRGTPSGVGPVRPGDRLVGEIDGLAPVVPEITP